MNTLLFIYNANSGTLNTIFDVGHKIFSPSTYQCNLCALTFDTFSENKQWKEFRDHSNLNMAFYHIDEFKKDFPNEYFEYPTILKQDDEQITVFLDKEEIDNLKTIELLINELKNRILKFN